MTRGKQHIQDSIEADAARIGFVRRKLPPDFRHVQWYLKCSKCPRDFVASWHAGSAPDLMIKNMRQRKWDVDYGMRPLCPTCAHGKDLGPVPKPEHQSFNRFIPKPTLIYDRLLDAAEERATKVDIAHKIEVLLDAELGLKNANEDVAAAKAEVRATRATQAEEDRRARHRQRISDGQKARCQRIKDAKAAQEAGAEALRIAQMKERACVQQPVIATYNINAPQAGDETMLTKPVISPAPKITHAVFQLLDGVFDATKRLYRNGYTDQRVAKECGTSEEVVAYLRTETFGQLAEDPRITGMRDDIELLSLESAEAFAKLQKQVGEPRSRLEQLAHR